MLQRKEMTTLLITVISTKMLLTFPRIMIINSGNSAWMQAIYNVIAIFLIYFVTTKLYRGNKNIIQLAEKSGGKPLKIVVGIITFIVLMIKLVSVMRIFPETVKIILLKEISFELIIVIFILAISLGAYIGIEPLAKINYMFLPLAGIVLLVFLLLLIPYYKVENILPIFGNGLKSIFAGGFHTISIFSDILLLNVLLPFCENNSEAKKAGRKAIVISSTIIIVILLTYCLIYPYPVSKNFMLPVYQLARVIHLSSFFSRFEAVFQFIWSIIMLLYLSIYIFAMCYVWQITFGLKYYKPLILPIAIISGVICILPSSLIDLIRSEDVQNIIIYPVAFLLPIIFGIVSRKYYGKKVKRKEEESE